MLTKKERLTLEVQARIVAARAKLNSNLAQIERTEVLETIAVFERILVQSGNYKPSQSH